MLQTGEDDLLCDMAETYGVLEPRALPPRTLATLAAGLGDSSRIRRRMASVSAGTDTQLLAAIVDQLALLRWQLSCGREEERPVSVLAQLCGDLQPDKAPRGNGLLRGFDSPTDFEAARQQILMGGEEQDGDRH